MKQKPNQSPWAWVPSLYFAQGLPYVIVITVSTIIYKNLGLSNADITFYTGWLYLPWVIKPFWGPFVDHLRTKRFWVVSMQLLMGVLMAAAGLSLPAPNFVRWSLIFFWLIAFSSATHDIAADGYYMLGLTPHQQSFYVGIRNTSWRIAAIAGQGGLVYLSGLLINKNVAVKKAWMFLLLGAGVVYVAIAVYHKLIMPRPDGDPEQRLSGATEGIKRYLATFIAFFKRKNILVFLLFVLFYRLGEAQLTKLAAPFLLDTKEAGGLALSNEQVGWAYGTVGMLGLVAGGILGGFAAAKHGLKFWLWPMAFAMQLPDLLYVYMAHFQPGNIFLIQGFIAIEQFGYGFGFTAYTLYLIYFVQGENRTSHYAFATGLMALGMMVPGILSGWIQEMLNYENFFIWVLVCTIPGFLLLPFLKIDKKFGKK
ncbi:MAG: MFS transporter [Prolixibacteraceae bacterium]|nr:MFS transporter [Prolixibacteraceae bacterium]